MDFLVSVFTSGVRISAPVAAAGLGETFSERTGIINVGLEGMMLMGAFGAVLGSGAFDSAWMGLSVAIAFGLGLALLHAFVSITLEGDQIVSGIAINLLALGATAFLFDTLLGDRRQETVPGFDVVPIPLLKEIPLLGPVLFRQTVVVYLLYALVALSFFALNKTAFGLKIQAAGENPGAADVAGINVNRIRYTGVLIAGAMAGLGGGILSLSQLRFFVENITGGRGFVALAAVIFGNWRPTLVALGAVFFGVVDALQLRLQAIGVPVPPEVMTMLPYVATLTVLAGAIGRSRMPTFLTRVYVRGDA